MPADNTFATKAEARVWLSTMETDVLGGRHVDPSSGRELFGVFAARWLEAAWPALTAVSATALTARILGPGVVLFWEASGRRWLGWPDPCYDRLRVLALTCRSPELAS